MAERVRQRWFESVALDDPQAVQKALSEVIYRLVSGQIEHKKAGQLLYRLQTAIGKCEKTTFPQNGPLHRATPLNIQ